MNKTCFSSLIFAFLSSISLATTAAPSTKPETPTPIAVQMTKAEQSSKVSL
ncbi:MAG TPA: competence protein ComEA, partial [Gammaproteobacteria bacterium]|nr:competence protein ComEA [Gammaproteobacteria bacterium]